MTDVSNAEEYPKMLYLHPVDKTREHRFTVVKDIEEEKAANANGYQSKPHIQAAKQGEAYVTDPVVTPSKGQSNDAAKQKQDSKPKDLGRQAFENRQSDPPTNPADIEAANKRGEPLLAPNKVPDPVPVPQVIPRAPIPSPTPQAQPEPPTDRPGTATAPLETKQYGDGTAATGVGPLPEHSPVEHFQGAHDPEGVA